MKNFKLRCCLLILFFTSLQITGTEIPAYSLPGVCTAVSAANGRAQERALHIQEIREFVEAERQAGRIPDIKSKFSKELDLWGADFSGLDLSHVNFSGMNLGDVNFQKTILFGADLSQIDTYPPILQALYLSVLQSSSARVRKVGESISSLTRLLSVQSLYDVFFLFKDFFLSSL